MFRSPSFGSLSFRSALTVLLAPLLILVGAFAVLVANTWPMANDDRSLSYLLPGILLGALLATTSSALLVIRFLLRALADTTDTTDAALPKGSTETPPEALLPDEVRRGLGELLSNLVRRNQSLLDRQIRHIDKLEQGESRDSQLDQIFAIDHLASRMRRNAETLLVLSGSDSMSRRTNPLVIEELIAIAIGEIEDRRHVQINRLDPAMFTPNGATHLAHLVSELLDNAHQFSPPERKIEIYGLDDDGAYLIAIVDHGIGVSDQHLSSINELLSDPPQLDLGLGRSLGLIVAGWLAKRLDLQVEVAHSDGGGLTALVVVPEELRQPHEPKPSDAEVPNLDVFDPIGSSAVPAVLSFEPSALSDDGDQGWTPPPMPERGATELVHRTPGTSSTTANDPR